MPNGCHATTPSLPGQCMHLQHSWLIVPDLTMWSETEFVPMMVQLEARRLPPLDLLYGTDGPDGQHRLVRLQMQERQPGGTRCCGPVAQMLCLVCWPARHRPSLLCVCVPHELLLPCSSDRACWRQQVRSSLSSSFLGLWGKLAAHGAASQAPDFEI